MKAYALKIDTVTEFATDEEFDVPIDISDILNICKEYNKLGWKIQYQVENLLELGIEEATKRNIVRMESLPLIKDFLNNICDNVYFGDAVSQAKDCIALIEHFELRNPGLFPSGNN